MYIVILLGAPHAWKQEGILLLEKSEMFAYIIMLCFHCLFTQEAYVH